MSKDVIKVDGEETVVREDTAKAFRGVNWALASIAIFIAIMLVLVFGFFLRSASDGKVESPAGAANSNTR